MYSTNTPILKNQRGFSLIEVLVSLALFAIVMTMSVGTLVVIIDANAKVQSMEVLVNNVSATLDSMTRELRTGYNYYCDDANGSVPVAVFDNNENPPQDCNNNPKDFLAFTESGTSLTEGMGSKRIAYKLRNGRIERHLGTYNSVTPKWTPVTPDAVNITTFSVSVSNAASLSDGDARSPVVTIYIAGDIDGERFAGMDTSFDLQTTVTQQQIDL